MGATKKFMISDKATYIITYTRILLFIPFFLFAFNSDPQILFGKDADWLKIINMIIFGFTNGYSSTLLAIKAPSKAKPDSKETVGTFVGTCIATGILSGSAIAIGMGKIVPQNPI